MSQLKKPFLGTLGAVFVGSLSAGCAQESAESPFAADEIAPADAEVKAEGSCGEGKCGGDGEKDAEGKCGEGKCGGDGDAAKKDAEGKCGEGKCGGDADDAKGADSAKKDAEGKCGEGKCGS